MITLAPGHRPPLPMTSFVEYHGHGFWCRGDVLAGWVRAVVAESRRLPHPPAWLAKAVGYWDAVASMAKSDRATLRLDADVTDAARQAECETLFDAVAADPTHPPATRRAALLALALIRGELTATTDTRLDYWTNEEWLT